MVAAVAAAACAFLTTHVPCPRNVRTAPAPLHPLLLLAHLGL